MTALNNNSCSICNASMHYHSNVASQLKEVFIMQFHDPVVIHWNGKLIPDLTSNGRVDHHQPSLVSGSGVQHLAVPKLHNDSGAAVVESLQISKAKASKRYFIFFPDYFNKYKKK